MTEAAVPAQSGRAGVMPANFVVARNPDPKSSLPILLRLRGDAGIELKAREPWPATARVYCQCQT